MSEDFEDIEIRVRVRVDPNSPEAAVLKYLNSKKTLFPKSDMVLISLISYWLPFACQIGECHKSIISCLYRLNLHQEYLKNMLPTSVIPDEEDESQEVFQSVKPLPVNPLKARHKQASKQYFTAIESQDISDSDSDETEWINPLKPQSF